MQVLSDLHNVQVNVERFTKLMETESDVRDTPEVVGEIRRLLPSEEGKLGAAPRRHRVPRRDASAIRTDRKTFWSTSTSRSRRARNVAIVGETGAGKSTLVNLVCRFFEPTEGQVLIDGRDARERSQLWLHSNIGYVLQTPHLFSGSVLENLRYGNPSTRRWSRSRRRSSCLGGRGHCAAARRAMKSDVGEGGNSLSTGEKQLLSFARALLADPRIFVLDEATSLRGHRHGAAHPEPPSTRSCRGRTSLVIAHRLSTVRSADLILVVHGGRIVESGSHRELMAAKGTYWQLYTRQYREE